MTGDEFTQNLFEVLDDREGPMDDYLVSRDQLAQMLAFAFDTGVEHSKWTD